MARGSGRVLQWIAGPVGTFPQLAGVDVGLDVGDQQPHAEAGHRAVAEFQCLREIVPGVHVTRETESAPG
jgi:hypothetical protein